MTSNHSSNATMATIQRYVFLPVDLRVRIAFWSVIGICGFYSLVANSIVLYLTRKQKRKRKRNGKRKPFDRFLITNTFVQSLAASDLLCGAITIPIAICTNFVNIIDTDFKCKVLRFFTIFLSMITANNLFIIGIERYCAVFHPFRVPSFSKIKLLVLVAWCLGVFIGVIFSVTFRLHRYDLSPERFTLDCVKDNTIPAFNAMFIGVSVVFYFVPTIILTITNLRVLLHLKRKETNKSVHKRKGKNTRKYGTITFASLIFAYILPYLLFFLFNLVVRTALRLDITYTTHYIISRVGAALAFSNSAISPTILLSTMPHLRKMLKTLVLNIIPGKDDVNIDSTFLKNDAQALEGVKDRRKNKNSRDFGNQILDIDQLGHVNEANQNEDTV